MKKTRNTFIVVLLVLIVILFNSANGELIPSEQDGKWGYCNEHGKLLIPRLWDYVSEFRCGKTAKVGLRVENGNAMLYGIINREGTYLVPCEYFILAGESETYFGGENGYYLVSTPDHALEGYYDIENAYFCVPKYQAVDIHTPNDENIISVADPDSGFWGYIRTTDEKPMSDFCYIETGPWSNGAAIATSLEQQWILFRDGTRIAIPVEYNAGLEINNGYFRISDENNKYGLMNLNAVVVTEKWYDFVEIGENREFIGYFDEMQETIRIKKAF